jgi:protein-tyrosine phosphatase
MYSLSALLRWIAPPPAKRVLMVCAANICRSPMARQVLQTLAERADSSGRHPTLRLHVESAGTRVASRAEPPDARAVAALTRRGYQLRRSARSRALASADFERFDLLLAMDAEVLADMRAIAPSTHLRKLKCLLDFAPGRAGQDVPDPYWGDERGFDIALGLCEAGCAGLLEALRSEQTGSSATLE